MPGRDCEALITGMGWMGRRPTSRSQTTVQAQEVNSQIMSIYRAGLKSYPQVVKPCMNKFVHLSGQWSSSIYLQVNAHLTYRIKHGGRKEGNEMMRKKMDGIGNDIRAVACSYDGCFSTPSPFWGTDLYGCLPLCLLLLEGDVRTSFVQAPSW